MAVFPVQSIPKPIPGLIIDYDSRNPLRGSIPEPNEGMATIKNLALTDNNLAQADLTKQCNFSVANRIPALLFSGEAWEKGDPVSMTSSTNYTCFLVYKSTQLNSGTMFMNGLVSTNGWSYEFSSGNRKINFHGAAVKVGSASTTNLEVACITWNGTTSTLSINGSSDTITNATTAPVATNGSSHIYIGTNDDDDLNGFEGVIYRVLLYSRVLSADELLAVNNSLMQFYGAQH